MWQSASIYVARRWKSQNGVFKHKPLSWLHRSRWSHFIWLPWLRKSKVDNRKCDWQCKYFTVFWWRSETFINPVGLNSEASIFTIKLVFKLFFLKYSYPSIRLFTSFNSFFNQMIAGSLLNNGWVTMFISKLGIFFGGCNSFTGNISVNINAMW